MALAVAQVGGNVSTGSSTIAATFGSATTTGSLVVAVGHDFAQGSGAYAAGDVTDSKSNTYSLAKATVPSAGGQPHVGTYYNNAGTRGASHQVTYDPVNQTSDSVNLAIVEITGQDSSAPYDSTTAAIAADGTSPFSVTAAGAISGNQIAIYGCTFDSSSGSNAWGDPTGYTPIISQGNSASLTSYAGYKINETGTPTVSATNADGVAAGGGRQVFATFKEASSSSIADASGPPFFPLAQLDGTFAPLLTDGSVVYPLVPAIDPLPPQWGPDDATTTTDQATTALLVAGGWVESDGISYDPVVVSAVFGGAVPSAPISHNATPGSLLIGGAYLGAPVNHDAIVSPTVYAGGFLAASPVGHDQPTTGALYAGGFLSTIGVQEHPVTSSLFGGAVVTAGVSHDVSMAASLFAGGWLGATVSHDALVSSLLFGGAVIIGNVGDQATFAALYGGGWVGAVAGHSATVSSLLIGGASLAADVSHDVSMTSRLVGGAVPTAIGVQEHPVTATLYAGGLVRATVGHDAAVSALLTGGAALRAPVGHDASVTALLAAGGLLAAPVGHDVTVTALLVGGGVLFAIGFSAVAPTLVPPLTTTAVIDGRLYTVAILDGVSYTVPIIDGRGESETSPP